MQFVEMMGGIALYLNGKIIGWICTTVDGKFTYSLHSSYGRIELERFETKLQAENALFKALSC